MKTEKLEVDVSVEAAYEIVKSHLGYCPCGSIFLLKQNRAKDYCSSKCATKFIMRNKRGGARRQT